jgi:pimeloyl-ACP methyl ester carboxylesterase
MMNQVDARRAELYNLLGDLPPRDHPVTARVIGQEYRDPFRLEKLLLDLNGIEPVPAYFLIPKVHPVKAPVILYNHSHGGNYGVGKEELLQGAAYLYPTPYAAELTRQGYMVLGIDAWGFGERRGRTEGAIFKEMLWNGQVMWGMMVYDSIKAIDYLLTRDDVDPDRIGTLGMSMGSTMSWWLAALDQRIKVCIDICCLSDFQSIITTGAIDGHGVYYFVPSLLKHFTSAQINALISPRPRLSVNGIYDRFTPESGLDRIEAEVTRVYRDSGAVERFVVKRYPVAHFETAEMRVDVMEFLNKWL